MSAQRITADRVDLRFPVAAPPGAVTEPQVKHGIEERVSSREAVAKTGAVDALLPPQQKRMPATDLRHSPEVFSIPQRQGESSQREPAVRTPAVSKQGPTLASQGGALSETSQQQRPGQLPMREITVQVRGRGDARVQVTLQEQNGQVNVVVRAPDREAVVSLRAEPTELARAVEERGFHIHTWTPSDTAPGLSQASSQSEGQTHKPGVRATADGSTMATTEENREESNQKTRSGCSVATPTFGRGEITMLSGATNSTSATSDSAAKPSVRANTPNPLSDKNTFLQLLIAQIKNQNPLSPTDGVQFLSQLAQFHTGGTVDCDAGRAHKYS